MVCHPAGLDAISFINVLDVASDNVATNTIAADAQAIRAMAAVPLAMQEVAASQKAMQVVANSQNALDEIGNNSVVQNTVYNNNTAVSALENSNLVESENANVGFSQDKTFKDDRVILLSHNPGSNASRDNQPQFGSSSNDFPHTADRVRRRSNDYSNGRNTNASASFIDISDS